MKEQVTKNERLSALVDDEADSFEGRRLIDELVNSEEDRRRWERYHLIGDSLRGGLRRTAPADFVDGIRDALADEPAPAVVPQRGTPRWLKPVAGTGVAAAVAMVTLVGMQMIGDEPGQPTAPVAQETGAPETRDAIRAASAEAPEAPEAAGLAEDDSLDPRFVRYLENHAELTGPGSAALGRVRYSVSGE